MLQKLRACTPAQRSAAPVLPNFCQRKGPSTSSILGGTAPFWRGLGAEAGSSAPHHTDTTTAISTPRPPALAIKGRKIINRVFDANDVTTNYLASFDLIFSNSFLEHLDLPPSKAQERLAAKICDSGKPFSIQAPNKNSPIDPHFPAPLAPFFAIYPRRMQAELLKRARLRSGARSTDINDAMERKRFYNPLVLNDMRTLFPGASFAIERPLGVPMSVLAWRDNWTPAAANKKRRAADHRSRLISTALRAR